jgi:hypothetical protein
VNGENNAAEITVLYENKDRFPAMPSIARLSGDKYLFLYHDAPARKPHAKFDPKMQLGAMTGPAPDRPDLKTRGNIPRFSGAGTAPGAVRLSDNLAIITDNRWFVYNWMGEPDVQVVLHYDWALMLRGGYSLLADASGEKLRFGKPRRITSPNYPAVSCYDNPLPLNENTVLCPVDYDSNAMQLQDRPWEAIIMRTDDHGAIWRPHGTIHAEKDGSGLPRLKRPVVRMLPGGRLVCSLVSHVVSSEIYVLESDDGGENWSEPKPTGVAGLYHSMVSLSDGRLLMTYSPLKAPYGVIYRISEDGGRTWPEKAAGEIDVNSESSECGWARGLQLDDGSVYFVYYTHKPGDIFAIMGARIRI